MKKLIYQYWIGDIEPCARAGQRAMQEYADRIGATYRFEHNPTFISGMVSKYASHYSALRPVFDVSMHYWDRVLFVDCDIFPVAGLEQDIFEEDVADIGICEEIGEPKFRAADPKFREEAWYSEVVRKYGGRVRRDENNLPRIFNSGLVLYTKEGMQKAKQNFYPMEEHWRHFSQFGQTIYFRDQSYMNAHITCNAVDWTILDSKWNTRLHYEPKTSGVRPVIDNRNEDTCMVHMQLSGSGNWDAQKLITAVNEPVESWSWR